MLNDDLVPEPGECYACEFSLWAHALLGLYDTMGTVSEMGKGKVSGKANGKVSVMS
jgi:hypothetical protein